MGRLLFLPVFPNRPPGDFTKAFYRCNTPVLLMPAWGFYESWIVDIPALALKKGNLSFVEKISQPNPIFTTKKPDQAVYFVRQKNPKSTLFIKSSYEKFY